LAFFSALPPVSACHDLPSMTVEQACRAATGTELMYELCKDAMRDVSYPSNGVDLYALVAAKRALASFDDTAHALDALLADGSLTGDEKNAYALCKESYGQATDTMNGVAAAVVGCRFMEGDLGQVYRDDVAQVERCRDRVRSLPASPIYARNLVDRNMAVLAYFVGRLLGVQ
uniref:Pectinesterase inhibitor domain-containing protein n=2 Tax=Setaria italica TaxID=4555 RepID=K3YMT0_SETIT